MNRYIGNIDSIEFGAGFVIVDGWFASTDDRLTPHDLHVSIDQSQFFPVGELLLRQDLIDSNRCRGRAGFRLDLPYQGPLPEKPVVTVFSPGHKSGLRFENIKPRAFSPRGALDRVDTGGVEGWVYDPSSWHAAARPRILIEDKFSIDIVPTILRHDVVAALQITSRPLGFFINADVLLSAIKVIKELDLNNNKEYNIRLISNGTLIAESLLRLDGVSRGNIDRITDGVIHGWAVNIAEPEVPLQVKIQIDGTHYMTVSASARREDLAGRGLSQNCGGFSAQLPLNPTLNAEFDVSATLAGSSDFIGQKSLRVSGIQRPSFNPDWNRVLHDMIREDRPVTVIIPIYNAPDDLGKCIESLRRHTTLPCRLLLIDDASPDPRIAGILAEAASLPKTTILSNKQNLGFVQTCNRGFGQAIGSDVVLLNSDTIVGPRWLENLRLAAYSRPRVATATPLSDNAGVFSAPEPNEINMIPPGWTGADMARFVGQASTSLLPTVPTGHGFCLFVRRDCLDEIGPFDAKAFTRGYGEENDFCMRALRAGYSHVMDDRSFVQHKRSASFREEKIGLYESAQDILKQRYPEYKPLTRSFTVGGPVLSVRWRLRNALKAAKRPPRPRILFVIASDTGGTPQTNRDLMRELSNRYEPWLLQSNSKQIFLFQYCEITDAAKLVESHTLETPVEMAIHQSEDYSCIVAGMLVRSAVELVHIRHVGWHGLDILKICQRLAIPIVFSFHDFYTICPSVKLIDSVCAPCCLEPTPSAAPCVAELWPEDSVPILKPVFISRWREMMADALSQANAFVTTTDEAKRRLSQAYPFLQNRDFRVIPHGRDFPAMRSLAQPKGVSEPLRILVPGNISRAKGAWLIRDIAAIDQGRSLEFHVLGNFSQLDAGPGIFLHGSYARDDFHHHVETIKPHIGAIFSRWPETYCHTLTEMWACGLPVFGTDIGAVGERILRHRAGWLHGLTDPPEIILSQLAALSVSTGSITARIEEVKRWQRGYGRDNGCAIMAAQYDILYADLFEERRILLKTRTIFSIWGHLAPGSVKNFSHPFVSKSRVIVPISQIPAPSDMEFQKFAGFIISIIDSDSAKRALDIIKFSDLHLYYILDLRGAVFKEIKSMPTDLLDEAAIIICTKSNYRRVGALTKNNKITYSDLSGGIDKIFEKLGSQ
jgi:GT2 family glycosyltransferase